MSITLNSINLRDKELIDYRTVDLEGKLCQSVNINQLTGEIVVTEPLENNGQVTIYPQSPNNPYYSTTTYKTFAEFGSLNFPLDARFDEIRNKLLITDSGNNRVLIINTKNYTVENEIENLTLAHSIIPDENSGNFFIKSFSGINTGIVYYYSSSYELLEYFTFNCNLGHLSTNIEYTSSFVKSLPIPSTMCYDHYRKRLWWTSENYVYMADITNNQIKDFKLSSYSETRGIDVEYKTGNAFLSARGSSGWRVLQIFKDNNKILGTAYIES